MLKPQIDSEFESLRPEDWKDLPVGFSSLGGRWKLLHVSPESGSWTAAFLNPKGSTVPAHIHVGPGEYFLVKGKLEVRGGDSSGGTTAEAPSYGYEATGARHDVTIFLEDSETYMRFQGPLQMIDEKGNTVGRNTVGRIRGRIREYGDSLPISTSTSGTALPSPTLTRKLGGNAHP